MKVSLHRSGRGVFVADGRSNSCPSPTPGSQNLPVRPNCNQQEPPGIGRYRQEPTGTGR